MYMGTSISFPILLFLRWPGLSPRLPDNVRRVRILVRLQGGRPTRESGNLEKGKTLLSLTVRHLVFWHSTQGASWKSP